MKNSKLRRALLLVASAVLLVCVSVGATLAYLTDDTEAVVNTFTVGSVSFDDGTPTTESALGLDEAEVDPYGENPTTSRTKENEYKINPGHNYIKDPTAHIGSDSEDAWLFVKVTNNLGDLEVAADYAIVEGENGLSAQSPLTGTIKEQMIKLGWVCIDETNGIYAYTKVVSKNDDIVVFKAFKISGTEEMPTEDAVENLSVTITAYLIQADGFEGATGYQNAWTTAGSEF